MIQDDNLLERVQDDTFQFLRSVPGLATMNLIVNNEGDIENKITRALQTLTQGDTGKMGLAVVVLIPEVVDPDVNLPGPVVAVRQEVQVIEHVTINRSPQGTGVRASVAALRVLHALQLQTIGSRTVHCNPKEAVFPVPMKDKNHVSFGVAFYVRANQLTGPGKVAAVHADLEDGEVVLTCATEGAEIRFTTDGSYPSPHNPQSQVYAGPLELAIGTACRAAAYAPDLNPGDCLEFNITI